jgi:phosphate:Na+ symporter
LLIGFAITALIQTSAATIVIVLSALNAKIIPLETAVAVVLGAELGTTLKIIIGAIGGIGAKKRVALSNVVFNLVSTFLGFVLLSTIVKFLEQIIGIKDPLIILVAFQSFVNIAGAILFYFFLNQLGDFLEKSFVKSEKYATVFLKNASPDIPDTATEIFEKEVEVFIQRVLLINEEIFLMHEIKGNAYFETQNKLLFETTLTILEKYNLIKRAEGEMQQFYARLLNENIDNKSLNRINQLLSAVRSALFAAKSLKDVNPNIKDFSNSTNEIKYNRFKEFQLAIYKFNTSFNDILLDKNKVNAAERLQKMLSKVEQDYQKNIIKTYHQVSKGALTEMAISNDFNLNKEVHDSCKSLILSAKNFLLSENEITEFNNTTTK